MAGGKETPRQKMIGMMYLVLTALLAMNVSKEVVNAFVTIDNDQQKNLSAIDSKINGQLGAMALNADENPAKYGPANTAALKIHKEADELIEHINKIKAKTFTISVGGSPADPISTEVYENGVFKIDLDSVKALVGIDNYDNNTNLMVQDAAAPIEEPNEDGYNYTAVELRNRLEAYRDMVVSEMESIDGTETIVTNLKNTFDYKKAEDPRLKPGEEEWVVKNFYHVPLAASTAMLSGLQNQIRLAESDLVDKLFTEVEGQTLKFNRLRGAVIPQATTISQGSEFQADIFMAAFDDQNPPEVRLGKPGVKFDSTSMDLIGEYDILEMDGVTGKLKIPSGGLGAQQREGVIYFKPIGGDLRKEPFYIDYSVVAPQLVVSPTKMNVFYKGLPNPVSVSVPGYTDKDVKVSISSGSMTDQGGGNYIVNVSSGEKAMVSAVVTQPDGSTKNMDPVEFRVKRIPDPVPSFGGKTPTDNIISPTKLSVVPGLKAKMENFDFEYRPKVLSYKIVTVKNGNVVEIPCSGAALTGQAKGVLQGLKRGQNFTIEDILVQMPGEKRKVGSISLRVK